MVRSAALHRQSPSTRCIRFHFNWTNMCFIHHISNGHHTLSPSLSPTLPLSPVSLSVRVWVEYPCITVKPIETRVFKGDKKNPTKTDEQRMNNKKFISCVSCASKRLTSNVVKWFSGWSERLGGHLARRKKLFSTFDCWCVCDAPSFFIDASHFVEYINSVLLNIFFVAIHHVRRVSVINYLKNKK